MSEINNTKVHQNDIPIECTKIRKCGWKGMTSDLVSVPHKTIKIAKQHVCPKCGNDTYYKREVIA